MKLSATFLLVSTAVFSAEAANLRSLVSNRLDSSPKSNKPADSDCDDKGRGDVCDVRSGKFEGQRGRCSRNDGFCVVGKGGDYGKKDKKDKQKCYNDFICPAYSERKHGRNCYDSFDDCKCDHGYEKKHDKCEKICYNDYQCPRNSKRKHNRKCYDSFKDCECKDGYEKKHGKCVKEEYEPKCRTRYIAHLDAASELSAFGALELTGNELTFIGFYDEDTSKAFQGHKMHIHNAPVMNGDCASTGGHYDPTGVEIEGYSCDPEDRETCYVGDLTGQFGKVTLDNQEIEMGRFSFDINKVLNRGVVVHDPDTGARIACGNIEAYQECE